MSARIAAIARSRAGSPAAAPATRARNSLSVVRSSTEGLLSFNAHLERSADMGTRATEARLHSSDRHVESRSDLVVGEIAPGIKQQHIALLRAEAKEAPSERRLDTGAKDEIEWVSRLGKRVDRHASEHLQLTQLMPQP